MLLALAGGLGLLIDRVAGGRVPGALVPGVGLAGLIVLGQFTTLFDATAEATVPVVVAAALVGYLLGRERLRGAGGDSWAIAAALGVYIVYAAPIVLSGEATFAGFIKLDDTATWLALTDRVMEHGRSLDGLAPSSYEATLDFNLADGYPIGVFIPLGVGAKLVGQDIAWLIQPYMALLAALLTLSIGHLMKPLLQRAWPRAVVAFLAAQSALLLGYALWGGVKEVAAAMLVALVAALVVDGIAPREGGTSVEPIPGHSPIKAASVIPAAVASAALLGVLSPGGAIWILVPLGAAFVLLLRQRGTRAIRPAATFLALLALLCVPLFAGGRFLPPTSSPLTDDSAKGNLVEALDPLQVAGIWLEGDFRLPPDSELAAYLLIAALLCVAVIGAWFAWRRKAIELLLWLGGSLLGFAVFTLVGSPWVAAKATAIASPAVLAIGLAGAAALIEAGRRGDGTGRQARTVRFAGAITLAALGASVLWSNALAYHEVRLAPREQLAELERIGDLIAGEGPALMTEYLPYGVRHFLRDADPEGVSELRRRRIALRSGRTVEKGGWTDTDRIDLDDLLVYETLVLRRSPEQSRPPSPYERVFSGTHYEVWQQEEGRPDPVQILPLGDGLDPGGVPQCASVRELGEEAGPAGEVVAAPAPDVIVADPGSAELPPGWPRAGSRGFVLGESGSGRFPIDVRTEGEYGVWLAGSVQGKVEVSIDDEPVGSARHQLNNAGLYIGLGEAHLSPGEHELTLSYEEGGLAPGSEGPSPAVGPLVLAGPAVGELVGVAPEDARQLCGRRWDWIEAIRD